jgi:hypothetical protein
MPTAIVQNQAIFITQSQSSTFNIDVFSYKKPLLTRLPDLIIQTSVNIIGEWRAGGESKPLTYT